MWNFGHEHTSVNVQGEVDSDTQLKARLRTQVGRLLDARWIMRSYADTSHQIAAALPADGDAGTEAQPRPWEEWDRHGPSTVIPWADLLGIDDHQPDVQTTPESRKSAYQVMRAICVWFHGRQGRSGL